jgi:hypothetical protein
LFKKVHAHFPVLEAVCATAEDYDVDYYTFLDLNGDDGRYLTYDELPNECKAEALVPILAASCLNLPLVPFKHIIQDMFGHLVFHSQSSFIGFTVCHRDSPSVLMPKAQSYLHGKSLSSLMGPCEEAFAWFIILTELLCHHNRDLHVLSDKYQALLSFPNDEKNTSYSHARRVRVQIVSPCRDKTQQLIISSLTCVQLFCLRFRGLWQTLFSLSDPN